MGTEAEYQSNATSTKDTSYIALMGELWCVFCEYLWENWLCIIGTALYIMCHPTLLLKHAECSTRLHFNFEWFWAMYQPASYLYFIQNTGSLTPITNGNLTHWGRVTYLCVGKLTIIGSDNGMSPGRHQAIIWTNDGILLIRTLETNFSEILIEIHTFSLKKCIWKCRLRNGVHFVSASMC